MAQGQRGTGKVTRAYVDLGEDLGNIANRAASARNKSSRAQYVKELIKDDVVDLLGNGKITIMTAGEAAAVGLSDEDQARIAKEAAQARVDELQRQLDEAKKAAEA